MGGHKGSQKRSRPQLQDIASDLVERAQFLANPLNGSCPNVQAVQPNCPAAGVDFDFAAESTNPFPNIFSLTEEDSRGKKDGNENVQFFWVMPFCSDGLESKQRTNARPNARTHECTNAF